MRPRLIILSGVGLALVMFASGLIAATAFFTAEPGRQLSLAADATDVWTDKSVKVNTAAQEFERFPARPVRQQLRAKTATGAAPRVTRCRLATNPKKMRGPRRLQPMWSGVRADTVPIAPTTTATLPIVGGDANASRLILGWSTLRQKSIITWKLRSTPPRGGLNWRPQTIGPTSARII